jgi:prefoldin alpha subunit
LRGVQEQLRALSQTKEALSELEALPSDKETWIPIAPGAYVRGTVKPAASVLLSVGSQVAVEKTPAEVRATLDGHETMLSGVGDEAITELKDVLAEMDVIREQVSSAAPPTKNTQHND